MKIFKMIFLLSFLFFLSCSTGDNSNNESTGIEENPDSLTFVLNGIDGKSVFELLQNSHDVDYTETDLGIFIKGIDSITNSSNAYWLYSVNDTMAQTSADKYITKNSDIISWHFRKSGF